MDSVVFIKIISALLYPLGLVVISGLFALIFALMKAKGKSKFMTLISVCILLVSSNPVFSRFLVSKLENQFPQQSIEKITSHQAIIVLGGGLRLPNGPEQAAQLASGSDRYWLAAQLYLAGKAPLVIVTGGNVYERQGIKSEAFYVAEILERWGVPESAIVIETSSRTTGQNAGNVEPLLREKGIENVLLVTSAIHMPRAYSLFESLPIELTPVVADVLIQPDTSPPIFSFLPSADALKATTRALHEYYGIWFNTLKNTFKLEVE